MCRIFKWVRVFVGFSIKSEFPEKETQKVKYKNPKVRISQRCEIVKSNNRIIKKLESSKIKKFKYAKDVK